MQSSFARSILVGLVLLGAGRTLVSAQADSSKPSQDSTALTLTGCVSGKPLPGGDYTFLDNTTGSKYRLTGKGLRKFAGQQVEIVSSKNKRFAVKGGLYPSPNVAAQAGALDPGQEAIARQPGGPSSGTAGTELPEFRVAQVRGVTGACQQ